MASTMLTEVEIDGENIAGTRLIEWEETETDMQEIRDCKISSTSGIYQDIPDLDSGKTITIKRGTTTATDEFVFDGYIDRIDKEGPNITIYGKDRMIDLIRRSVNYSYDGENFPSTESKGSDIAKDLIETWGGMTATVVDTGTDIIIKKFICNGTDIFSRLQIIADIYDYMIRYDSDDQTVHFEPKGYTSSPNPIFVGGPSNNVSNLPKWTFDNIQCVNKLIVKGAVQEVRDTQYFDGDGSAGQIFTLGKKPISVELWEEVAAVWILKVPGVVNSTSGDYDYTVQKEQKTLNATANWDPAAGSSNVRCEYVNAIPVPIQVEDETSQEKYGIYQAEKFFSDIQDVEDAENRGNAWVAKYGSPFVQVMFKPTLLFDYEAGQKVPVTDLLNNETRELIINKIVKRYPHNGDQLHCGDKEWRLAEWGKFTLERVRRLEEENQKNTDLIISIKNFPHIARLRRRFTEARVVQALGDGFILSSIVRGRLGTDKLGIPYLDSMIWGNPTYAAWNTATWGSQAGSEIVARVVWPNSLYKEKFIDDYFEGTGTATWDTTNRELVFV